MARFAQDKLEELRERASIVEVVGAHVRLKRAGRNYVGLCPFHNEKTPSFSVNAERGFFHCFGCGAGGTVFDFVMRLEGLTFPEAVQSLARRYGVTLPETHEPGGPAPGEREAMYRANEFAAAYFSHVLWKTPSGETARVYLKSRAIADETARAFSLGFAPVQTGSLANALQRRNLVDGAVKAGLIRRDGGAMRELFIGRLMFPIRNAQGRVVAFGGRVLDDRLPKYINSPESPIYSKARSLYGLHEARQALARADRAIVVEGYFDAIVVSQAGFKEVVASLGTSLTVEQLRLLSRHTRNVIAAFDGDEAGRKASMRALEVFLAAGLLGRGIFIPAGFDPDTFIQKRGAQSFGELLERAELLIDFFVREEAAAAGSSLERQARAAERVAEVLRQVANPFEFDLLARKASAMLGVNEEVFRNQGRKPTRPAARAGTAAPTATTSATRDAAAQAELGIVSIAIARPELRAAIGEAGYIGEFRDQQMALLLDGICHLEESDGSVEEWLAERMTDEQRGRLSAMALVAELDDPGSARALLRDYARALMRRRTARAVEELRREVVQASDLDDATRKAQELIALRRGASNDPA